MTLDNSSATELDRTITWQFDNATHLVGIIETLKDFYQQSTQNFWDSFVPNAEDINTASDYGLALWGKILGYYWPSYSSSGTFSDPDRIQNETYGTFTKVNESWGSAYPDFYYLNGDKILLPYENSVHQKKFYLAYKNPYSTIDISDVLTSFDVDFVMPDSGLFTHSFQTTTGVKISSTLYRKILKARFVLLNSRGTFQDYLTYLNSIFGNGGVSIVDNNDMSVTLDGSSLSASSEEKKLFNQQDENLFLMPAGVQFKLNPTGRMFMLADVSATRTKANVIADYPSAGGLDESTFTWS